MVREERWIILVELRGKLLDVTRIVELAYPLLFDSLEESIWVVVFAALEFDHPLRVLTYQETNDISRAAVMSAV